MDGPVLRYAERRGLLRQASQLGIGEFEASLIIAAVQHERRRVGAFRAATSPSRDRNRLGWVAPLLVVTAVELLLAFGAWQVWVA